jgi:predicted nucleic acid-binding protein
MTVRVLLDTNLLIAAPRLERLDDPEACQFFTAALCYAELREGEFSADPAVRLRAPLDYARAVELYGRGLPFDDAAAGVYRAVCQTVVASGRSLTKARRIDLMIAATALACDCALATRNTADFAALEPVLPLLAL